jgi:hypothetical protein
MEGARCRRPGLTGCHRAARALAIIWLVSFLLYVVLHLAMRHADRSASRRCATGCGPHPTDATR